MENSGVIKDLGAGHQTAFVAFHDVQGGARPHGVEGDEFIGVAAELDAAHEVGKNQIRVAVFVSAKGMAGAVSARETAVGLGDKIAEDFFQTPAFFNDFSQTALGLHAGDDFGADCHRG